MWTKFWDMYSGGGAKEKWSQIYIEAPEDEARVIFYNMFDHNPDRVTCTCCGPDYSVSEEPTLEEITAYDRECKWNRDTQKFEDTPGCLTVSEYEQMDDVRIIRSAEIKDEHRVGDVPQQGYVWH